MASATTPVQVSIPPSNLLSTATSSDMVIFKILEFGFRFDHNHCIVIALIQRMLLLYIQDLVQGTFLGSLKTLNEQFILNKEAQLVFSTC